MPDAQLEADVASLGHEILAHWPDAAPLSHAELKSRFVGAADFVAGWRLRNVLPESPFDLLVVVREDHPWRLPVIALPLRTDAITYPHVEASGILCLAHGASVFELPVSIAHVEQLVSDARQVISLGRLKQNDEDFFAEANSYWTIVEPSASTIWLLDPPPDKNSILVAAQSGKDVLVAASKQRIETWARSAQRKISECQPSIFLRAEAPMRPTEYPLSMGDLTRLINALGAQHLLRSALKSWKARRALPVVISWNHNNKDVLLGAAYLPLHHIKLPTAKEAGIPGFRTKGRIRTNALLKAFDLSPQRFPHMEVTPIYRSFLLDRTTGAVAREIAKTHVVVVGCGALGGQLAVQLAQAGVGKLTLIDNDVLDWRNVGRHVLDGSYVGSSKVHALKQSLLKRFPDLDISSINTTWEAYWRQDKVHNDLVHADLLVSLTGDPASNQHLDMLSRSGDLPPVVFGWLEPFGVAAHAIFRHPEGPGLSDCSDKKGLLTEPVTDRAFHPALPQEASCGALYQPYSALISLHAVALVGELVLEALLGQQSISTHRVWVGAADEFSRNNLSLTEAWHLRLNSLGYCRRFDIAIPRRND